MEKLLVSVAIAHAERGREPRLLPPLPELLAEDLSLMRLGQQQEEVSLHRKDDRLDELEPRSVVIWQEPHPLGLLALREIGHRRLRVRVLGQEKGENRSNERAFHKVSAGNFTLRGGPSRSRRYTPARQCGVWGFSSRWPHWPAPHGPPRSRRRDLRGPSRPLLRSRLFHKRCHAKSRSKPMNTRDTSSCPPGRRLSTSSTRSRRSRRARPCS